MPNTLGDPCAVCGGARKAPRHRRDHDYQPMSWPLPVTCARCGRQDAELWSWGVTCPRCSPRRTGNLDG